MKGKAVAALVAAAVLCAGYGGLNYGLRPYVLHYADTKLRTELADTFVGPASFDNLTIGWDGTVIMKNVHIDDAQGRRAITIDELDSSISLGKALKLPFSDVGGLGALSSVRAKNATVMMVQETDGQWNLSKLMKEKKEKSSFDLRADVALDNGRIIVVPKQGPKVVVDQVNGHLLFAGYPKVNFALAAMTGGSKVETNGFVNLEGTYDASVHIKTDHLKLAQYRAFLPKAYVSALENGEITEANLTVKRESGQITGEGRLSLDKMRGEFKGIKWQDGRSEIKFWGKRIHAYKTYATVNGTAAFADATVELAQNWTDSRIDGVLRVEGLEPKNFGIGAVEGQINGQAHIFGTVKDPMAHAIVDSRELRYEGIEAQALAAKLSYKQQKLYIDNATAQLGQGMVRLQGQYGLDSGRYAMAMESRDVPLVYGNRFADLGITDGAISGTVNLSGHGKDVDQLTAKLHGDHLALKGLQIDSMDLGVVKVGDTYHLSYATGTMGKGRFSANGDVRGKAVNLNFGVTELPVGGLAAQYNLPASGGLTVSGSIKGSLDHMSSLWGQGTLSAERLKLKGASFHSLYTKWSLSDGLLRLEDGQIGTEQGTMGLDGSVGITGEHSLDLKAFVKRVRIESLSKMVTDVPVTGWLSLESRIGGTVAKPTFTGKIHAWDGSIYGRLFTDVTTTYSYDGHRLDLPDMALSAYGSQFSGSGTMDGKNLDFSMEGNDVETDNLLRGLPVTIKGRASVKGQLKGTIDRPQFTGEVTAKRLLVNQSEVENLHGVIYGDPDVVNMQRFDFDMKDGGSFSLEGGMGLKGDRKLFGNISVKHGELGQILGLGDIHYPALGGYLSGKLNLGGTYKRPEIQVHGTVADTRFGQKIVGDSTVDFSLEGKKVTINTLRVPIDKGILAAQGTADLDGDASIQVAAKDIPLTDLWPLVGKDIGLTGKLNGIINVTGRTNDPEVELSSEIKDGRYNGVAIDSFIALMTMKHKVIHINQILGTKGPYKVVASGEVPLAALYTSGALPPGSEKAMNLNIDMNGADLAVIPLLTTYVTDASGPISGNIHIGGSYDQPQVTGHVKVEDGTVNMATVRDPLEHIAGDIEFKGQSMAMKVKGTMGKGKKAGQLTVNGNASWQGMKLQDYEGSVEAKALPMRSTYFTGPLTGNVLVKNNKGRPLISGNLDLSHDLITIPLSFSSSDETYPVDLDFTVTAGRGTRLYNSVLFSMSILGSAHFGGSMSYPQATGGFTVQEGTIKYLSNQFKIREGQASFEPGSLLPKLNLMAKATVQNYKIELGLKGPLSQMNFELSSDPHLEQGQIISLLTFGRQEGLADGLTSADANALVAAGLRSLALGYLENVVRDSFKLDLINVTTGSISPNGLSTNGEMGKKVLPAKDLASYYNIEIGKYVLPNLMLTLTQGLNNDQAAYGIQYDINRRTSVGAQFTNDHHTYIGGQWSYQF